MLNAPGSNCWMGRASVSSGRNGIPEMPMPSNQASSLVDAMLASAAMDRQASYLRRGRVYAKSSDDEVKAFWSAALKVWVDIRTDGARLNMDDLESELDLRNIAVSWEAVPEEREQMLREIAASNPNDPGVRAAITEFLDDMDEPQG